MAKVVARAAVASSLWLAPVAEVAEAIEVGWELMAEASVLVREVRTLRVGRGAVESVEVAVADVACVLGVETAMGGRMVAAA